MKSPESLKALRDLKKPAAVLTAFALSFAGGWKVAELTKGGMSQETKTELKAALQPQAVQIGSMVLQVAEANKAKSSIGDSGDWGKTTVTVDTRKVDSSGNLVESGEVSVGMREKNGKLDPSTTFGVSVTVYNEFPMDNRGHGETAYAYIESPKASGENHWKGDAQAVLAIHGGSTAYLTTEEKYPLENLGVISDEALRLTEQALSLPVYKKSP